MDQHLTDLFSEIDSEAKLKSRFVAAKQPETNHVEFKEKSDSRIPDLHKDDRRNFSKALSAFSNADGGLLIWGVRTRFKDGRDVAWTLKPIKQVKEMAERLRASLLDTLMPQIRR
jgi:predicted HTH transcriptional regulator